MSGQHCQNYDVKRETVHCYPRNVDRCCTWSEVAWCCRWNLSAFFKICFCFVLLCNKSLKSQCFPRLLLGKHWDSRETKFTVPLGTRHKCYIFNFASRACLSKSSVDTDCQNATKHLDTPTARHDSRAPIHACTHSRMHGRKCKLFSFANQELTSLTWLVHSWLRILWSFFNLGQKNLDNFKNLQYKQFLSFDSFSLSLHWPRAHHLTCN